MASDVERIKEKLPIEEVVGAYVKLDRGGGRLKGLCPFHSEKSPSFFVSPERGTYYCFGCGAKGDIFTFVQEFEHLDFIGALKSLADRAGVELSGGRPESKTENEALYEILDRATLYYQKQLALSKDVQKYLTDRGLAIATIKSWRIGFAPDEWTALSAALKEKGYSEELINKAGLSKPSEKNPRESYDRFRNRIMFPLFDISGRVIGFSGRIYGDDPKAAKYLNSPETKLFDKSSFLYGLDRAKLEIRKKDQVILVEGQMDLIMSHQAGITNTVAVSGTALTETHIRTLRRFAKKIVLVFDSDSAGVRASTKSQEHITGTSIVSEGEFANSLQKAMASDMEVSAITIEGNKDPADLIKEDPELWKKAIEKPLHLIEFKLKNALAETDELKRKRRIQDEVLPFVKALNSPLEEAHFIGKISLESGIAEKVLNEAVSKIQLSEYSGDMEKEREKEKEIRIDIIERKIAALLLWKKDGEEIRKKLGAIDEGLLKRLDTYITLNKDELVYEAEASFEHSEHIDKDIDELVKNLHEEYLKRRLAETLFKLKQAEVAGQSDKVAELLSACQEISTQLHTLKKQL